MPIELPKPKITTEQWDKFLKNPEVVTLEVLFVIITVGNLFILYRILLDVCPFPIFMTWFQLFVAFLFAFVLGFASSEFPRCAFFPPFTIDFKLYQSLMLPTMVYLGMVTFANVLLKNIPSISSFPTAVSLAVVLHHLSRFVGCGQMYLPIRWISVLLILVGFVIGCIDTSTIGLAVFPIALLYGSFSSIFRAWCLEKAMHVVEGKGNTLHNHQVVLGLFLLPGLAFLHNEAEMFSYIPCDFSKLFTWQYWGIFVIAGSVPFIKNVIANRMIRKTGQAPWRILEAISMVFVFLIGGSIWDKITLLGLAAFTFVLSGRILGTLDALSKDPEDRRRALRREEAQHESVMPSPRSGSSYSLVSSAEGPGAASASVYTTSYDSINDEDDYDNDTRRNHRSHNHSVAAAAGGGGGSTHNTTKGLSDSFVHIAANPLALSDTKLLPEGKGKAAGTEMTAAGMFGSRLTLPLSGYSNDDDDDDGEDRLIITGSNISAAGAASLAVGATGAKRQSSQQYRQGSSTVNLKRFGMETIEED